MTFPVHSACSQATGAIPGVVFAITVTGGSAPWKRGSRASNQALWPFGSSARAPREFASGDAAGGRAGATRPVRISTNTQRLSVSLIGDDILLLVGLTAKSV